MKDIVWLNGRLLPASRARISPFDHGFLYGDGIYETFRASDYRILRWPQHCRRLKRSARRLALRCPWTAAALESAVVRLLRANRAPDASVRLTLTRGEGPLGLDPALCHRPTLVIQLHPRRDIERLQRDGVSIAVTSIRRNDPRCLDPRMKSNNALNTLLAKVEAKRRGAFEAVLLNLKDELTEGSTTNLFFVKGETLCTPALSCGLLEGVMRGTVLGLARRTGLRVREGRYPLAFLRRASEVFLTSATLGIVPVTAVMTVGTSRRLSPGPFTRRLQDLLRAGP